MDRVRIGFIPLVDCAVIAAAYEQGFAARHGLDLALSREPSWAAIRDKVAFGVLDGAHMLAPMPVAMSLGLGGQPRVDMVAPLGLGDGGNAITVSAGLHKAMTETGIALDSPLTSAQALAMVVARRKNRRLPRLRLASVFPFSCHDYELRLWLEAGGIAPDDVELMVIPPPRMVENMALGLIDGFCVGEPWNLTARADGIGVVVATKAQLAPDAPEKVLGMTRVWAQSHADTVNRLIVALSDAAKWAAGHGDELAEMLAQDAYVGVPAPILKPALTPDALHVGGRFAASAAPLSPRQIAWLGRQMERWSSLAAPSSPALEQVFLSSPALTA